MVYCLFHYNGNTTTFTILLVDMVQFLGYSPFSLSNCNSLIKFVNSLQCLLIKSLLLIGHLLFVLPSSLVCLSPLSAFHMHILCGQLSGPLFRMDMLALLLFLNDVGSLSFSHARLLWL